MHTWLLALYPNTDSILEGGCHSELIETLSAKTRLPLDLQSPFPLVVSDESRRVFALIPRGKPDANETDKGIILFEPKGSKRTYLQPPTTDRMSIADAMILDGHLFVSGISEDKLHARIDAIDLETHQRQIAFKEILPKSRPGPAFAILSIKDHDRVFAVDRVTNGQFDEVVLVEKNRSVSYLSLTSEDADDTIESSVIRPSADHRSLLYVANFDGEREPSVFCRINMESIETEYATLGNLKPSTIFELGPNQFLVDHSPTSLLRRNIPLVEVELNPRKKLDSFQASLARFFPQSEKIDFNSMPPGQLAQTINDFLLGWREQEAGQTSFSLPLMPVTLSKSAPQTAPWLLVLPYFSAFSNFPTLEDFPLIWVRPVDSVALPGYSLPIVLLHLADHEGNSTQVLMLSNGQLLPIGNDFFALGANKHKLLLFSKTAIYQMDSRDLQELE